MKPKRKNTGRKKLPKTALKKHKLQTHVNQAQYQQIMQHYEQSDCRSQSEFIKKALLIPSKYYLNINPASLLKQLDQTGLELKRIGHNINQVARYANQLNKQGIWDVNAIIYFNQYMTDYLKTRRDLVKAYRSLIRQLKNEDL